MKSKLSDKYLTEIINEELAQILHGKPATSKPVVLEYEDPLAQVFLQPFKDIVDTTRAGLEKTTATAWGNTKKIATQAATLLLPGVPVDAFTDGIDDEVHERLQSINSKYKDVIQSNYDMMRSRDLWGVPFLLNPALMTGVDIATKSPEVALAGLEAITGGNPTITKMRERLKTINTRVLGGGWKAGTGGGWAGGDGGYDDYGDGMFEQANPAPTQQPQQKLSVSQVKKSIADQIAKAANSPAIKKAIDSSPVVQELRKIGEEVLLNTVQQAIAFSTYDEMKKVLGTKFASKENEVMQELPEGATEQQTQEFKQALVGEMKTGIKNLYVKQVEKLAQSSDETTKAQLAKIVEKIKAL